MKKLTALSLCSVAFVFAGQAALAHDFHWRKPLSKLPVKQRAHAQRRIIAHDKRVLQSTRWVKAMPADVARFWFPDAVRVRTFHARQKEWTTRELRESERMLRASVSLVPGWFYAQAMCIHGYESRDWHEGYPEPVNGMQFFVSTWTGAGGSGDPVFASPAEQVYRAFVVWKRDGGSWREWSTAGLCGLR